MMLAFSLSSSHWFICVIAATKDESEFQSFDKVLYLMDDLVARVISHTAAEISILDLIIQVFAES